MCIKSDRGFASTCGHRGQCVAREVNVWLERLMFVAEGRGLWRGETKSDPRHDNTELIILSPSMYAPGSSSCRGSNALSSRAVVCRGY